MKHIIWPSFSETTTERGAAVCPSSSSDDDDDISEGVRGELIVEI